VASDAHAAPGVASVCYADQARIERMRIVARRAVGTHTHRIRVEWPTLAGRWRPGQFAMVRIADRIDPLLARPLAIYETYASAGAHDPDGDVADRRFADFLYLAHGKFTRALSVLEPGAELELWGPLGNGFRLPDAIDHLALVAGGIGQTALLALGRAALAAGTSRVTLCWGAREAGALADHDDFRRSGIETHLATLDGSSGLRGTVVDLLDRLFADGGTRSGDVPGHVACCGPEPMMAAVGRWCGARGIGCSVSLETPMACGIGICFSCVAPIRDATGGWDYRRTCVEGPVFDARDVVWPD